MTPVTPIEPRLRRPETPRRPRSSERPADRPFDRPLERDIEIAIHREPRRERSVALPARAESPTMLSELALAARFFPLAGVVVAIDLATKAWATTSLAHRSMDVVPGLLSLSLAFNPASAGGVWLGEQTRAINFTATGVVIGLLVMLAPHLTRLHRAAWIGLALIVGAGVGNLVGLAEGARGVVDFIAIEHGTGAWVLNVADVALLVGLVLLARTVRVLIRTSKTEGARVRVR